MHKIYEKMKNIYTTLHQAHKKFNKTLNYIHIYVKKYSLRNLVHSSDKSNHNYSVVVYHIGIFLKFISYKKYFFV